MILVKNSKFLSGFNQISKLLLCVLFFEKGLEMYFYDVVYKSRRLVRLLKCYFDLVKNFAFYRRGYPMIFGQKFKISFYSAFL